MATLRPNSEPAGTTDRLGEDVSDPSLSLSTTQSSTPSTLRRALSTSSRETILSSATSEASSHSTDSSTGPSSSAAVTASAVAALSTSDYSWGPAITASPFPSPSMSSDPTLSSTPMAAAATGPAGTTPLNMGNSGSGMSSRSMEIIIATTVIGGTFIIALLVYAIHKRRRGATYAQILHVPRQRETVVLTPTPMRDKFFPEPVYRDLRYSVHSANQQSQASIASPSRPNGVVPAEVADRFHTQNAYIQNTWKLKAGPRPPPLPRKDPAERHTFLFDASPTRSRAGTMESSVKEPEKARVSIRPMSSVSQNTPRSSRAMEQYGARSSMADATANTDAFHTPPGSPGAQMLLGNQAAERWSWTNSQAPSTPRMRPSSMSSRKSLPKFRSVMSWARGQAERIDEEAPPIPPSPLPPPMPAIQGPPPVLKNQASKPTLAPRKLSKSKAPTTSHVKSSSSKGSLGALFKSSASRSTDKIDAVEMKSRRVSPPATGFAISKE